MKKKNRLTNQSVPLEVPPRLELGNEGFADLCLTTCYGTIRICPRKLEHGQDVCGAVDGIRTRDIHLGKVALYH